MITILRRKKLTPTILPTRLFVITQCAQPATSHTASTRERETLALLLDCCYGNVVWIYSPLVERKSAYPQKVVLSGKSSRHRLPLPISEMKLGSPPPESFTFSIPSGACCCCCSRVRDRVVIVHAVNVLLPITHQCFERAPKLKSLNAEW